MTGRWAHFIDYHIFTKEFLVCFASLGGGFTHRKPFLYILLAFILLSSISVYAHSGRTDSSGGHYVGGTSEYHYHHGHPAHQHPNGVCPYKTTSKINIIDKTETVEEVSSKNDNSKSSFFLLFLLPLVGYTFYSKTKYNHLAIKTDSEQKNFKTITEQLYTERDLLLKENRTLKEYRDKLLVEKNELLPLKESNSSLIIENRELKQENNLLEERIRKYQGNLDDMPLLNEKEIFRTAGVPDGVSFDEHFLPHYYQNEVVEKNFQVYISNTRKHYHRIRGCCQAQKPVHLFIAASQFSPCSKCVPVKAQHYQIPVWYYHYLQLAVPISKPSRIKYQLDIDPFSDEQ